MHYRRCVRDIKRINWPEILHGDILVLASEKFNLYITYLTHLKIIFLFTFKHKKFSFTFHLNITCYTFNPKYNDLLLNWDNMRKDPFEKLSKGSYLVKKIAYYIYIFAKVHI